MYLDHLKLNNQSLLDYHKNLVNIKVLQNINIIKNLHFYKILKYEEEQL